MDTVEVAIGIVLDRGRILICRRPDHVSLPGLWEFPGGKRLAGETLAQCLARELREELAIEVRPVEAWSPIEHDYPFARVRLYPFLCALTGGHPRAMGCQRFEWIDPGRLPEFQFPPANEPLIRALLDRFAAAGAPPNAQAIALGSAVTAALPPH